MRTRVPYAAAFALLSIAAAVPDVHPFAAYREATLPNGLRVVLIEHHANPMVAASVIVGAGVVHEAEGRSGASHLLEHLLFNGTTTRTQRELYDEVDRYGAYNNATTREDHTLFSLLIQKEFAEQGLEIQADMLFRSTIPAENFEKEKGIVLEEMARDASDPGYAATLAFRRWAFAGTPLANPVLGTTESIAAASRDEVVAYYKERYAPRNMVLVVMGDFESAAMLATVSRVFGATPAGKKPAVRKVKSGWPPPPEANLRTADLQAPRTYVKAAFPLGLPAHAAIVPAIELLLEAAGSGDDAPLQRALTGGGEAKALAASLGLSRREAGWSTVAFDATVAKDKPWRGVLDAFGAAISDLGPGSAVRSRLDLVRARVRAAEILGADQIHYFAMTHTDGLLDAPPGWLDRAASRFDAVTDADLDAAAAHLAAAVKGARVLVTGPGLPDGTTAWVPAAAGRSREGRNHAAATLPSGARIYAQRNDDSRVFALHLALRPRAASEPEGREGIASFLHRLFGRGTAFSDAAAMAARLGRLGAALKTDDDARVPFDDYYTTPEFSFVRLEMPAEGWREGVALVGEILRHPRIVSDDVEAVRAEMVDLVTRRASSSRSRALDAAERWTAPGHPLTRPVLGTAASLGAITVDDLKAFHRDYVTGRRLVAAVVAPVDAAEVVEAIEGVLGDLAEGPALPEVPPVPQSSPAPGERRAADPKEQATIVMTYVFDAPEADRPALAVMGAMLSDALAFDLRETKGLAYQIGASVAPWGGRQRLLVTMGTRAENLDAALAGLREGVAGFAPAGEEAVRRAAAAMRGRLLMRRLTRVNQAYFATLDIMDGRPPGEGLKRLEALLSVNLAQVAAAAERYLDASRFLVVVE